MNAVPSAASFYIPTLPDLHQDEKRPLRMYGGHLSSDPNATNASPTDVTAHLYFFMVKARRTADKERILFWLNVSPLYFGLFKRLDAFIRVAQDARRLTVS